MKRDVSLFLKDILKASDAIESFVEGLALGQFSADDKTSSAVVKKLEIMGEAAKQIPQKVRNKIPLPWKEMAGMGDRLTHSYFGIDFQLVWDVVKNKLPEGKKEIEGFLAKGER
ncbi:DUF86 domain-containing protein [Candidatus Woesearchaeota archaeon]|nr:DUF86 domain-containing protein [Candidatus Woesearchaeota archaeon]